MAQESSTADRGSRAERRIERAERRSAPDGTWEVGVVIRDDTYIPLLEGRESLNLSTQIGSELAHLIKLGLIKRGEMDAAEQMAEAEQAVRRGVGRSELPRISSDDFAPQPITRYEMLTAVCVLVILAAAMGAMVVAAVL